MHWPLSERIQARASFVTMAVAAVIGLSACVTINVYFPAAEVQRAADKLIDEVWGSEGTPSAPESAPIPAPAKPNASVLPLKGDQALATDGSQLAALTRRFIEFVIPAAHAQANVDVSSPSIQKLKGSMQARHGQLAPHYASGAVGLTDDGLITVRDRKAIPLKNRQGVIAAVASENRDRKALYQEIARVNGHPEWSGQIQNTFAARWVSKARAGWWYQRGGKWAQKK